MATLPPGFVETVVASGLTDPTAMEFSPDGALFVAEQGGTMEVVRSGNRVSANFFRDAPISVNAQGERGLLGIAFDPNFATNRFVYVYYTATSPEIHNRVSRFTADASGNLALPGSETVLLDIDPLSSATNHNGGAIHFGPDGKLYVAVGDNASSANAQTLANLKGKMLRIHSDGSIPSDNPFFTTATGPNRAIWALGLRNPFTFTFQPGTGRMFINDVGQSAFEEINEGFAGANYGWPTTEGPTTDPRFVSPFHAYGRTQGRAITGGAFYHPATNRFPADYAGDYFFADFVSNVIRRIDTSSKVVTDFAANASAPVDLRVRDDGALYYLARAVGQVLRVDTIQVPVPTSRTTIQTDPPGLPVAIDGQIRTSPVIYDSPVGEYHSAVSAPFVEFEGVTYVFLGYTDGGRAFRELVTTGTDRVLTATYQLSEARVNFQPSRVPVPPNFQADTGERFGPRANGLIYGWSTPNRASARALSPKRSPDQALATSLAFQPPRIRWEIAVPDGFYRVRLVASNAYPGHRVVRLNIDGIEIFEGRTRKAPPWIDQTLTVLVNDGRITLKRAPRSASSRIHLVEITRFFPQP